MALVQVENNRNGGTRRTTKRNRKLFTISVKNSAYMHHVSFKKGMLVLMPQKKSLEIVCFRKNTKYCAHMEKRYTEMSGVCAQEIFWGKKNTL